MQIAAASDEETLVYAADELARYIGRMTGVDTDVVVGKADSDGLRVGTGDDLPGETPPTVDDRRFDDAIQISVDGDGEGVVCGNTPRACLQAVYRYLREQGCRWVRPGGDGEAIPDVADLDPIDTRTRPSYRHRGVHLSGNVDESDIREYVDWVPKAGYNAVIIEHHEGEAFKKGRARRSDHPAEPSEPLSDDRARELHAFAVDEIERRDLIYHAVGHNWTGAAIGMIDSPREQDMESVPEEHRQYLARLDGDRELYGGGPRDTELCYSNPEARRRFTEAVTAYAAEHPQIDVLHVWLSDGHNNHCECEDCRGTRPADYYVRLLNGIDDALSEAGLAHRIAFLAYTDLLWPPVEAEIENEDRFVLMFAPIRRDYTEDYGSVEPRDLPPYERNDLEFPVDLSENVAFLDAWFERFGGDSFVFDYHFWRAHYRDPGSIGIARLAATDMAALGEIGLDGSVSCNARRVFFPTGLGMTAAGAALWDRELSFDSFADGYLEASFGREYEPVREYLEGISERFDQEYLAGERSAPDTDVAERFGAVPGIVDAFRPTIDRNRARSTGTTARSWERLDVQADLCAGLAAALSAQTRSDADAALARWRGLKTDLRDRSEETIGFFDLQQFERAYDPIFEAE